ncbi:OsmC family protein [Panacagrimonas sp.]|uniref:OsmC family protein n=1 Tax=Panacagrimonas sp. TaxID=2480088 RepID=UPI003B53007D
MAAQGTKVAYALSTEGRGMAQTARVRGTRHVIEVDAVPAFGGHDGAPGPLAYALAALTSCSQITAQATAQQLGIHIDRIDFELESEIDLALLLGATPQGRPDFQGVDVQVTVQTDAGAEAVARLQAETERRCPVYQLFTRSGVPIRSRWTAQPSTVR